jgi:hypothetical protein
MNGGSKKVRLLRNHVLQEYVQVELRRLLQHQTEREQKKYQHLLSLIHI